MLAAVALLPVVAGCTANIDPERHRCGAALAAALKPYGLTLSEMADPRWHTDTTGSRPDGVYLTGFRFYGKPPMCSGGRLAVQLGPKCQVQDIATAFGCSVPGID